MERFLLPFPGRSAPFRLEAHGGPVVLPPLLAARFALFGFSSLS